MKTGIEMLDFDDAVGVAMLDVDSHPYTLLIGTADNETRGLKLDNTSIYKFARQGLDNNYK